MSIKGELIALARMMNGRKLRFPRECRAVECAKQFVLQQKGWFSREEDKKADALEIKSSVC